MHSRNSQTDTGPGILGFAVGGFIGFLVRPSAMLIGQLPFETVILRAANLEGLAQVLVPLAQASFNVMLAGAVLGLVAAIVMGRLAASRPTATNSVDGSDQTSETVHFDQSL